MTNLFYEDYKLNIQDQHIPCWFREERYMYCEPVIKHAKHTFKSLMSKLTCIFL